jgi:hypothetical protein
MFSPLRATVRSNDNSTNRILISSLDRGGVWSAPAQTSDSTKFAPSQIFFRGKFWLAFVANDAGNNILVCRSDNGLQFSQPPLRLNVSAGSAPSLAVSTANSTSYSPTQIPCWWAARAATAKVGRPVTWATTPRTGRRQAQWVTIRINRYTVVQPAAGLQCTAACWSPPSTRGSRKSFVMI